MLNLKKKRRIDAELKHYENVKMLEIDKNIEQRKINNWEIVDEARIKTNEILVELAKLEGLKEAMLIETKMLKMENEFLRKTIKCFAKIK